MREDFDLTAVRIHICVTESYQDFNYLQPRATTHQPHDKLDPTGDIRDVETMQAIKRPTIV